MTSPQPLLLFSGEGSDARHSRAGGNPVAHQQTSLIRALDARLKHSGMTYHQKFNAI
jgi:hypothetical protein